MRNQVFADDQTGNIALTPDGKILAMGSHTAIGKEEDILRLWRVSDGSLVCTLLIPHHPYPFAFSPDGKTLGVVLENGTLRLYKVR